MALAFVRRFFGRKRPGEMNDVIQLFTPQVAVNRGAGTRLALAGVTVASLAFFGFVAAGAFVTLLLAVGALYFLLTQVLGIELDIDPQAFMARAREYASQGR
jgi:hypothetical protein